MSAAPSEPAFMLRGALDLYSHVDDLGPAAVGELFVSGADDARGAVFVERGRVCWAAAHGLAPRLSQLLGARANISPAEMEVLFLQCKTLRAPLGEQLIARGLLSKDDLREALLQHTVESLRRLTAGEARAAWCPRPGKGYSPTFTFSTAELLVRAGAERHRAIVERAEEALSGPLDDADWAAAFVRGATHAFPEPIGIRGRGIHRADALVRMGKWAASALDVVATFNDAGALLAVTKGDATLIAFREGEAIVAASTASYGPARLLNRRARLRRSERNEHAGL